MYTCAHAHTHTPVRPHQVGQRLVSLTTPEANMSRKSNQRTSHSIMLSLKQPRERPQGKYIGATNTHRNPVSSSRLSLWDGTSCPDLS